MPTHNSFDIESSGPVDFPGGQLRKADIASFPILKGMALFTAKMPPGGVRVPHWHPNCAEMDYVVSGRARFSVVGNDGTTDTFEIGPGEIAFIPQAYFHYFESIGEDELHILVWFNNEEPEDIGLPDALAGIPIEALAAALKAKDPSVLAGFSHSGDYIVTH